MTDAEFWSAFWSQSISRSDWTHEAHLRLGWLLLGRYDFERAMNEARRGICLLNSVIGATVGYHETITRAYLILIQAARMTSAPNESYLEFKKRNASLFTPKLGELKKYYSEAYLYSPEAKIRFMPPDLKALPE